MIHKLSLYGFNNFKKGHNSGTPVPNLTQQMSWTFTLYKVYVYQLSFRYLDNCGISIRKATWRRFVTCFHDVAAVLEYSREYRLSKLDITERTMQTFKWWSGDLMHSSVYILFMFSPLHGWLYKAWITLTISFFG